MYSKKPGIIHRAFYLLTLNDHAAFAAFPFTDAFLRGLPL